LAADAAVFAPADLPLAVGSVSRPVVVRDRVALTGADASPALAALVRVDVVRAGFAAASDGVAGVDLEPVDFALVASEPAAPDFAAVPLAAGALAGEVLAAAGRAGGVVPLAVEPVRLVAVAFRGRVWFAATVTFASLAGATGLFASGAAAVNRPFGAREIVAGRRATLATAGSAGSAGAGLWEALRGIAVVWSRVDRSPAAVQGSAEPFVAFAITYARVP
jgi:hypothetical protein